MHTDPDSFPALNSSAPAREPEKVSLPASEPDADGDRAMAARVGYPLALATALITILTFGIAIFTPPLSGPYCQGGCYFYPYTDIAARFPRDYLWIYPAIPMTGLYLALMAVLHRFAAARAKVWSQMALSFATLAAGTLILDYFVQLAVIQPSLLQGETDGISLLSQFNPHGIFIALEEIGFLLMSVSFLCAAPVFGGSKAATALRWTLRGSFALTLLALAGYSAFYGLAREYRFEVAVISICWLTLIAMGFLLSRIFRRAMNSGRVPTGSPAGFA